MITPQDEKGGWISSLVVGLIGSMIGGFLGRLTGLSYIFGTGWFGSIIVAVLGAILVLYLYHKYFKEKLNVNL